MPSPTLLKAMYVAVLISTAQVLAQDQPNTATGQQHTSPSGAPQRIELAVAQKAIAAAQGAAAAASARVAIAIVDANGDLVEFVRLDGAPSLAVTTSEGKARAAVLFGVRTKVVQDAIASGQPLQVQLTAPRSGATEITAFQGGVPILKDGKVIAGIGVGGSAPPTDEKIAQAGAEATGSR